MCPRTMRVALAGGFGGFALAATALAADKPFDFSGSWLTTEGIVPFTQSGRTLTGTYPLNNGRMRLTVTGDTAEGFWAQSDSVHRCTKTKDGSHYWGAVQFKIDPGGQSFNGRRNYCGWRPSQPGGDEFDGRRR